VTPPKPEEKPPEEQAKPEEPPKPDAEALPDNVPTPVAKPQVKPPEPQKPAEKPPEKTPDQPKTAEKPTDKKKADQKQEMAKSASSMKSDFNADEVAALLNKTDPSAGGAKRSTQEASLGAKKSNGGSKLSQSEEDAMRSLIEGNWLVTPGMEGLSGMVIKVHMKLDKDGNIIGQPEVESSGGSSSDSTRRALEGGAYRAVMKSAPFSTLPKDKYDAWNEVELNFDPSSMGI
jgi:outer membrane biosynthesis protein TonB